MSGREKSNLRSFQSAFPLPGRRGLRQPGSLLGHGGDPDAPAGQSAGDGRESLGEAAGLEPRHEAADPKGGAAKGRTESAGGGKFAKY